jgi:ribonuclease HII
MILIAGVDEAGRGCLAGNVFAAAVILNPNFPIIGLADSKVLSAKKREFLSEQIKKYALSWTIMQASVDEIDDINILQASLLAMKRAIEGLHIQPSEVLIDGNQLPKLSIPARAIVQGDKTIQEISAASILAKVARDESMVECAKIYPQFSFAKHKGYGTKLHCQEIEQFGILDIHRKSFNPVRTLLLQK